MVFRSLEGYGGKQSIIGRGKKGVKKSRGEAKYNRVGKEGCLKE